MLSSVASPGFENDVVSLKLGRQPVKLRRTLDSKNKGLSEVVGQGAERFTKQHIPKSRGRVLERCFVEHSITGKRWRMRLGVLRFAISEEVLRQSIERMSLGKSTPGKHEAQNSVRTRSNSYLEVE